MASLSNPRSSLVVGNWKMNGSREFCETLLDGIGAGLAAVAEDVEVAVCPPFVYLPIVSERCAETRIVPGAQDVSAEEQGAFTGEVAGNMLADLGARFVIVGHSERRELYGESDALVAGKFVAVQQNGMTPILCVGESLQQRQQEITEQVVLTQLDAVIERAGVEAFSKAIIAYEPIWAIGTGETASPEQAQQVHALIRQHMAEKDGSVAAALRILYGGSVKGSNAAELFAQPDIDGGLVGGASLEAEQFVAICASAER